MSELKLKKWEFEMLIFYIFLSLIPGILFGFYHGLDIGIITFVIFAWSSIFIVYGLNYRFKKRL